MFNPNGGGMAKTPRTVTPVQKKPTSTRTSRLETNFPPHTQAAVRTIYKTQTKRFSYRSLQALCTILLVGAVTGFLPPLLTRSPHTPKALTSLFVANAWGDNNVEVWWPTQNAQLTGTTPFKAMVQNQTIDQYTMYWQVDSGQKNEMSNSYQDYPHKEYLVDLAGWNWKGHGPYTLTFSAYDLNGNKLGEKFITIYIGNNPAPTPVQPTPQPEKIPVTRTSDSASGTKTYPLDIWWPSSGATVSGNTPFKAYLQQNSVEDYTAYWQVNNGPLTLMPSNYTDYPHKEQWTDISSWQPGSYFLTFIAKNASGQEVGKNSVTLNVQSATQTPLPAPARSPSPSKNSPILNGAPLFVNPNSEIKNLVKSWANAQKQEVKLLEKIAEQPDSQWFGGWNWDIQNDVDTIVTQAANQHTVPVLVAYNIPGRDCGGYSAGGTASADAYKEWIQKFAQGIGNRKAAVILEPDALSLVSCLSEQDKQNRYSLLQYAVSAFKALGNTAVYIDAGHPGWISTGDIITRLKASGIDTADGFALNVSNFETTQDNIDYGTAISSQVGNKHFVIDTSRNGNGPTADHQWCNPSGRKLGNRPTTNTGNQLVDAFLWIKGPGGSDGYCNGGPSAGTLWTDYALDIAQRS